MAQHQHFAHLPPTPTQPMPPPGFAPLQALPGAMANGSSAQPSFLPFSLHSGQGGGGGGNVPIGNGATAPIATPSVFPGQWPRPPNAACIPQLPQSQQVPLFQQPGKVIWLNCFKRSFIHSYFYCWHVYMQKAKLKALKIRIVFIVFKG